MKNFIGAAFSLLFLASCAGSEQIATQSSPSVVVFPGQAPAVVSALERPLHYPVVPDQAWQAAVEAGTRTLTGEPGPNYWSNRAQYVLSAELDPANRMLHGTARITYSNNSPDPLQAVLLELAQNLHKPGTIKHEVVEVTGGVTLHSVSLNGSNLEPTTMRERFQQGKIGYIEEGTMIALLSEEAIAPGETAEIDIEWSFPIAQQGASGRMGWSRDNLFYIGYWYPQLAVYDDVNGWFQDPFTGTGEFYHGFADYDISITAPAEWVVMSTGEFLNPEETLAPETLARFEAAGQSDEVVRIVGPEDFGVATREDNSLTWNFRAENVRDVAFSATKESIWDGTRASVGDIDGDGQEDFSRIHSFWRESAPLWRDQAKYAQHSIEFLSRSIAHPYPWPHMTSVEGEDIIGGGMEFPMMTVIGPYNGRGPEALYSVTAHELAHMWFPMIVSSNERRYSWMDEGTTDFNTHLAESDYWPNTYDNTNVFNSYLQIAGTDYEGEMTRWSDHHYFPFAFGIASYSKPAAVLLALRAVLGDEMFDKAFHTYMERWQYKHPYPWDMWNTFEDVSGQDLDWFWRSWYHETWTLDHAVESVSTVSGSGSSSGAIRTDILVKDLGNVIMPVDLEITYSDGSTTTTRISHEIWLSGVRSTTVSVSSAQPVVRVAIDPGLGVPDVDRSNNFWEAEGE